MSEKKSLYRCCKICGIPMPERYEGMDFDFTQQHAFLYHPDLTDQYSPIHVRELIETGMISQEDTKKENL
jgi:hypothetical protein